MGMNETRRFPAPWTVEQVSKDGFYVRDANGVRVASVYCRDDLHSQKWADYNSHLTSDEARRIAKAIARLPELLKVYPAFVPRYGEQWRGRYWRASRPYTVALRDAFVQENYDEIVACCTYNNVPFDPTGEILDLIGIRWRTYQFARQLDAIRFWHKFDGRWMLKGEFHFPQRPADLPVMKSLPGKSYLKRPPAR
jgi:hypothetical protein